MLIFRGGFTVILLLSFAACRSNELEELSLIYPNTQPKTKVQVNFCTRDSEVIETQTKYIFVTDKSGSNQNNYRMNPDGSIFTPFTQGVQFATDPQGQLRYPSLLEFLDTAPPDVRRFYSMVNFSTSAAVIQNFTNDTALFRSRVQDQYDQLIDQGSTNYIAALDAVRNLIVADVNTARAIAEADPTQKKSSMYIIVFVSDGFPIMSINPATVPITINAQSPNDIYQRVRNIVSLQNDEEFVDGISLFTGYYFLEGNQDPNARTLLKNMAEQYGNGIGFTYRTGESIDYSVFSVPPKLIKYTLGDIFVTNQSVQWWDDSELKIDTDGDGLPDDIEIAAGSSPTLNDSDRNGVSDFVEHQVFGNPCASVSNGNCNTNGRRNFLTTNANQGGCSGITPISNSNNTIVFSDTDRDGLNVCEERVLGNAAGIENFDSNADGIPDGLSFRNRVGFRIGDTRAFEDPFNDGFSLYSKIKFSLPTFFPLSQLLNVPRSNYQLTLVSGDQTRDCYRLEVTEISVLGPNNQIQVQYVERSQSVTNRQYYHIGKKRFNGDSLNLQIDRTESGVWQ